jgi:hypothetical protein
VFPRRTSFTPDDDMVAVGEPGLWLPDADEVHISGVFSWDRAYCEHLADAYRQHYSVVRLGGPAFGSPADDFTPGLYVRRGVTFTSRGCNRHCPFCVVPCREGPIRELEPIAEGNVIQDNNFLQTSKAHRERVYEMLRRQSKAAVFAGGIDPRLVTPEVADEFRGIRIASVFLSADVEPNVAILERAMGLLGFLGRERCRCYVLCAYRDDTLEAAESRLRRVWNAGTMPFPQLYQEPDATQRFTHSAEWRALQRTWARPAATKAHMREVLP